MTLRILLCFTVALILANLPFLLPRAFGRWGGTAFVWRFLAWGIGYLLALACGFWLARPWPAAQPLGWEFYVTLLALFTVAAWPGFVWRYLWQSRRQGQRVE